MSYALEDINGCTKKFAFKFESLDLSTEIQEALKEKQKSANLKGFRKGKAPLDMIQKFYGPQVESDAINRFVQKEFYNAIVKEDIRVVGYPQIGNMAYDNGKSISFDATVEIFPIVELKDMSSLKFKKEEASVSEEDLEAAKNQALASKAEMVELTDDSVTLENGQFAVLNFEGVKPDGTRPEEMKGQEFLLEIGSGQFIPGFEEKMIGMKKSEKKDIELTFPEDYHADDLKNAKVTFEVELLEIKEKKFPELSDEIAKELGHESAEEFSTKTKKNLENQKERQVLEKLHQEILEKLVEENKFDIPGALIAQQEEHVKKDLENTLKYQGFNEDMMKDYFSKWSDDMRTKAEFQVRSGIILDTIAKKHKIETTEEDFEKKLKESSELSGMDYEQIKQYYTSNEQIKNNMMYAIREEKTFEIIKSEAKVS